MKKVLMETAENVCKVRKGPPLHKETWWWSEEVETAVKGKKTCFRVWKKSGKIEDWRNYTKSKLNAKRVVAKAKQRKSNEMAEKLESDDGRKAVFHIAKRMAKDRQDVIKINCLRDEGGNIIVDETERKKVWKEYMSKLLNEENEWDHEVDCGVKVGPPCLIDKEEVRKALNKMKFGKAGGPSNVVSEMLVAAGEVGLQWLTDLCNNIIKERRIPEDWKHSLILPIYKGKGDPLECGSYRAIKLLEHGMKVLERVLEKRIREQVKIDEMQFGFTPGKGTTDAIFIVRQVQEQFRAKKKMLYYAFVDLEKAYDRVPREVVQWALRKAGVDEWLVDTVMCLFEGAKTAVKTDDGVSEWFDVQVGLHQGSALSPLLFIIVMDVVSHEIKGGLPWEVLYADDLVLMAESEQELKMKLGKWKLAMESKGMRVNTSKTKVMGMKSDVGRVTSGKFPCGVCGKGVGSNSILCVGCDKWIHKRCCGIKGGLGNIKDFICGRCKKGDVQSTMSTDMEVERGVVLEKVGVFCYLGDMLDEEGGADRAVIARIGKGWNKFRVLAPLMCAKSTPMKVRGRLYSSCVRSCMIYGSETWAMSVENQRRLERAEMQMLRRISNVTMSDRVSNEMIRRRLDVESIVDVVRRGRLRWFGHVERKSENDWLKKCQSLVLEGNNTRGRPKLTWREVVTRDMNRMGLSPTMAQDRCLWRRITSGLGKANLG